MAPRWIILALLVLVLVPTDLIGLSHAQPIQISVGQSSITMNMHLLLQENLTSLPLINTTLADSNSSTVLNPILQPINSSISRLVPTAKVTRFQLDAQTFNASGTWLLKENFSITVAGANENLGSSIRSDLDFIAMNVSQSMMIANQELNAVGSAYLLAPLDAQDPKSTVYYIDGHQTLSAVIPAQTTVTFWLLDLTWLPPISSWPETRDLLGQSTIWSLDTGAPRYNLTLGRKSPEGPLIKVYMATYYPTFSVSVPANAWIDRNTVSFDLASPSEAVMPIVAAAALVVLIAVSLLDRRLTSTLRIKKKR